jgi:hypothetical protein
MTKETTLVVLPEIKDVDQMDVQTAESIKAVFQPMLDRMTELEGEYNKVIKLNPNKTNAKKAGDLRKKYVKVRTDTDKLHKQLKKDVLLRGRVIDGWKNAQLLAGKEHEAELTKLEKYVEIEEKRIKDELREKRVAEIRSIVGEDTPPAPGVEDMDEEMYNTFVEGLKAAVKQKAEAAEAEAKRIAEEEQKAAEEKRKLEEENARLKAEAVENARKMQEIKDREEAAKAMAEEEAEEQALQAKNRGDKNTMLLMQQDILTIIKDYDDMFQSQNGIYLKDQVATLLGKVSKYINDNINTL